MLKKIALIILVVVVVGKGIYWLDSFRAVGLLEMTMRLIAQLIYFVLGVLACFKIVGRNDRSRNYKAEEAAEAGLLLPNPNWSKEGQDKFNRRMDKNAAARENQYMRMKERQNR